MYTSYSPKKRSIKKRLVLFLSIFLFIPILFILFIRLEGEKPSISHNLNSAYLGASQELKLIVADTKSGLKQVQVAFYASGNEIELIDKQMETGGRLLGDGERRIELVQTIEPKKMGLAEGKVLFRITAWDLSWRGWLHGNKTIIEKELTIDFKPPIVTVMTKAHNVNQGGSGLVIYEVSEECPRSGVQVGEHFFPGHSGLVDKPMVLAAFFALAHNQDTGTRIFISATDSAGNTSHVGFTKYLKKKRFKKDKIVLGDQFLSLKMPEFDISVQAEGDDSNLAKFILVNNRIRKENTEQIKAVVAKSEPAILWEGPFLRLANSKRMAGYADHRTYYYQNKKVDEQTHLGIDLAAYSRDKVTAANRGKVAFADGLGIYGQTVIIDHGFGIFSMYSHLSRMDVSVDQIVAKNEPIGLTGSTGMAGGDHLHFSMLIHDTFVNPVEWWDGAWIKNNITTKIADVQALMPQ